ncbi:MAG TPA: hypothetical protein VGQ00_00900 [Candidatus Norongarragalinales archaeon]|jgi:hypothetical protein|nr:hypothetical protein [Candidatus Norongarragalinales archaeon]
MAQLDAIAIQPVLTPESAIDLVQKEVKKKGWTKFDLGDIKLVYTPFYVFNYDVSAEGQEPQSGRAAINAYTGDLDEFVPVLLERSLKKSKTSEPGAEIESTAVKEDEVRSVAQRKIAGMSSAKRDDVTVSAISKIYVPFFRVFVDVADDTFKIDVDAALGSPEGVEAIPAKTKTTAEVASATIKKMTTPQGFLDLLKQSVSAIVQTISGKGKGLNLKDRNTQVALLLLAAVVLLALYLAIPRGMTINCAPDDDQVEKTILGTSITPRAINEGQKLQLTGSCTFENRGGSVDTACATISIMEDGQPAGGLMLSVDGKTSTLVCSGPVEGGRKTGIVWITTWNYKQGVNSYTLSYSRV